MVVNKTIYNHEFSIFRINSFFSPPLSSLRHEEKIVKHSFGVFVALWQIISIQACSGQEFAIHMEPWSDKAHNYEIQNQS